MVLLGDRRPLWTGFTQLWVQLGDERLRLCQSGARLYLDALPLRLLLGVVTHDNRIFVALWR